MIPCADPRAAYLAHKAEIDKAVMTVLDGGRYILGENVTSFEAEFASFLGTRHAAGVGSGTDALHVALRACGVGPGDEVVTVAHSAVATVAAIARSGARPVLVDIDRLSYTMDPDRFEQAITPRTKAVIPVHLYGQPADMSAIVAIAARRGLRVIEDCAQAHGARDGDRRAGTLGDIAAFSFYPTKNLGAFGDGGLVATGDADLLRRVRLLREYGWEQRYVSASEGWNTRLDELQAAVLRVKLRTLDACNERRSALAALYRRLLVDAPVTLPAERLRSTHAYHLFVVRTPRRDAFLQHMYREGIGVLVHYPVPIHHQPAYRELAPAGGLPETESAARQVVSLPLFPELAEEDVQRVAAAVLSAP